MVNIMHFFSIKAHKKWNKLLNFTLKILTLYARPEQRPGYIKAP